MKPIDVHDPLVVHSASPEMLVCASQSMGEPLGGREDPPEPTLSLSPKNTRTGKDGRRQKKNRNPSASPTKTRSPRAVDIVTTVSREPPESGRGYSDSREERFVAPSSKGAEPPAQETLLQETLLPLPPQPDPVIVEVKHQDAPASGEPEMLVLPHEFKKTRSMRSTRSAAGSRRSSSRRRKMRIPGVDLERTETAEAAAVAASNSLHGVFNGHLMKWRFEAEEGGPFLRVPAFCGSTTLIVTTTYGLIFDANTWTILSIILSLFIYAIALLSIVLEGRFMCTNPLGIRAHLRSALTRKNRIFRFVWGRGLLYIAAGGLSCGLVLIPSMIAGIFMALVGVNCVILGAYSSRMFYLLRDSLKDDDYLSITFNKYDYDGDGYITLPEFVNLLSKLGMDLDDRIGIKAFHAADINHEYKISFEAFQTWWRSAFLKNGKAPRLDDMGSFNSDEEEGSAYRRMG